MEQADREKEITVEHLADIDRYTLGCYRRGEREIFQL
jgi:hypothetical protein